MRQPSGLGLVRPDHGSSGAGIHMYESLVYAYATEPHRHSILDYDVTLVPIRSPYVRSNTLGMRSWLGLPRFD